MLNQPLRMQEHPCFVIMIMNIHTQCTYQYSYQDGSLHTSIWMYILYRYIFTRFYTYFLYVNNKYTYIHLKKIQHFCIAIPLAPFAHQSVSPLCPFAGRLGRTISKLLGVDGSQEAKVSTGNKTVGNCADLLLPPDK